MKIATIVPVPHLNLVRGEEYHMCLAHLMNGAYREFYASLPRSAWTLMDNGSVETGMPLPDLELFRIASESNISEMTLPDMIRNKEETLRLHRRAADLSPSYSVKTMAIPQGSTRKEWTDCASAILDAHDQFGVDAIGISRFQYGIWDNRAQAIKSVPGLIESDLDIHLLGCWGNDPTEAYRTNREFEPGRIRGIDSGIAAIYTQAGEKLGAPRPNIALNFNAKLDPGLLRRNLMRWISMVRNGA